MRFLIVIQLAAIWPFTAGICFAQTNDLQYYTPPPMFDETQPSKDDVEIEKAIKPVLTRPTSPPPFPSKKPAQQTSLIKESPPKFIKETDKKVIEVARSKITAPLPQKKPEDISLAPQENGVVRGPKTMPAVPAKTVETELLFEAAPPLQEAKTAIRQAAEEEKFLTKKDKAQPDLDLIKQTTSSSKPSEYVELGKDIKKLQLYYQQGATELEPSIKQSLQDSISLLKENINWRTEIRAFASPQDQGHSSDRRIALTRALAIRSYLIENNIEPRHIDVRALGSQTDETPIDRVDLILYGPSAKF